MDFLLNGTRFQFDQRGFLTGLEGQGRAFMTRGKGLFDLAQPVRYEYENIRLEPDQATFSFDGRTLQVQYARLRPDFAVPELPEIAGGVSALLTLTALEDGRSVSMQLAVRNHAKAVVRQVMFPFFKGLDAVDSERETRFTTLGFLYRPFEEMDDRPERRNSYFAKNLVMCGRVFHSDGYMLDDDMIGRYYDYGSLQGGFSLYSRHWGFGPDEKNRMGEDVFVRLRQKERLLWIGGMHPTDIAEGGEYESGEYIFTPHDGGWENGIKPYQDWVDQNKKRPLPTPDSIRNAIGFRTVWMEEQYPCDPDSVVWKYDDLPAIAEDMLAHGLREISLWGANEGDLPITEQSIGRELGGPAALRENVEKLYAMGVNPAMFVSFVSIWRNSVERYGLALEPAGAGWAQNLKAIPSFQTAYMDKFRCAVIHQDHALWQQDVRQSLAFFRDQLHMPSIGWDQYLADDIPGGVRDLLDEYRRDTVKLYPDATFHSESCFLFEADINTLDYTWDWAYFVPPRDMRAYIRVVGTTRPNINVDNNLLDVKRCFMDNIFMNIMPSRPNGVNGSAYIRDYPALSSALRSADALRKRYLRFFRDGDMAGDCVLGRECEGAYVTGYRLPEETLVFVWARREGRFSLELPSLAGWELAECLDFDTLSGDAALFDGGKLVLERQKDQLAALRFVRRPCA